MGEVSRVPNLQMEFNYLDSFKVMAFLVISLSLRGPHDPHVISTLSPSSLHCPCHPHIIPIAPRRLPCGPHGCGLRGLQPCCPRGPHIVPVIPMSSPSSPWHPCYPHVIPTSSRRSPRHPQPPRYPPQPTPEGWGPRITKNAIRFELIEIF